VPKEINSSIDSGAGVPSKKQVSQIPLRQLLANEIDIPL